MISSTRVDEPGDREFVESLLKMIRQEFGREGLARFTRIYCVGSTDYTRDRHLWLSGWTMEDIIEDMRASGLRDEPSVE